MYILGPVVNSIPAARVDAAFGVGILPSDLATVKARYDEDNHAVLCDFDQPVKPVLPNFLYLVSIELPTVASEAAQFGEAMAKMTAEQLMSSSYVKTIHPVKGADGPYVLRIGIDADARNQVILQFGGPPAFAYDSTPPLSLSVPVLRPAPDYPSMINPTPVVGVPASGAGPISPIDAGQVVPVPASSAGPPSPAASSSPIDAGQLLPVPASGAAPSSPIDAGQHVASDDASGTVLGGRAGGV